MSKELSIPLPKEVFIDFVFKELKREKREDYILEIKVYRRRRASSSNKPADIEVFYRKIPKKRPLELSREEFEALVEAKKKDPDLFGFISYSFAFKYKRLELIVCESWGKREFGIIFDVKVQGNRLEIVEDSMEVLWHMKGS